MNPVATEARHMVYFMARCCRQLFNRLGSYSEVSRQTGLDRRTVRKYMEQPE